MFKHLFSVFEEVICACVSVRPSVCMYVWLCLFMCLRLRLHLRLCLCLCLCLCLSVCLSVVHVGTLEAAGGIDPAEQAAACFLNRRRASHN